MIRTEEINETTVIRFDVRELQVMEQINSIFTEMNKAIEASNRRNIVVDLAEVEYLSSVVLGKLLMAKKKVETAGGRMVLCNVSPHIRLLFGSSSMPLFEVHDNEEAARQSFGIGGPTTVPQS